MLDPSLRPDAGTVATEADLRRWYWLRSELVVIARRVGVSTAGPKLELTERIADALAGRRPAPPSRRATTDGLGSAITGSSVVPAGQRCTQALRAYLTSVIGPQFRFDTHMREVIATGGVGVDAVVERWWATRRTSGQSASDIDPQFEYNRFTRAWRATHPDGDRAALLQAWWNHRSAPRTDA